MSVVFSGSFSGRFVSTGQNTFIPLPSGVDRKEVNNETVSYAAGAGNGAQFLWVAGDAVGQGTLYTKEATIGALVPSQLAANAGFFLQDQSIQVPGALHPIVSITGNGGAFAGPQVLTGDTANMAVTAVAGADVPVAIVRIINTAGAQQLGGLDFSVANVVNNVSFDLIYMDTIVNAAGPGSYRIIPFDPIFYPRRRYISYIQRSGVGTVPAGVTRITMTVTHGYFIGQQVRFVVPTVNATSFGTTQMDGLDGTIVAINIPDIAGIPNTIDVDIDSSSFTNWDFPLTNAGPFTPAQVFPFGEDTATALLQNQNILSDATYNTDQTGMLLVGGASSPAGSLNDVVTWIAFKSFNQ
jgi:hypothetical protein